MRAEEYSMKRSMLWCSLAVALLAAPLFAEEPAVESAADRCVGKLRLRGALYDYQKAALLPGVSEVLDELAKTFRARCSEKLLIIEVHAFEMPSSDLNQRLSELRAHTLRYELAQRGIPERQTMPVGMGDTKPIVSVTDPGSLGENRRITFRIAD
jgi:outer membrane protein OmpA-like peptidoglycan-associated protein